MVRARAGWGGLGEGQRVSKVCATQESEGGGAPGTIGPQARYHSRDRAGAGASTALADGEGKWSKPHRLPLSHAG